MGNDLFHKEVEISCSQTLRGSLISASKFFFSVGKLGPTDF